ncbi:hypothetical protein MRX96_013799 [Rhipicephalus microplus]
MAATTHATKPTCCSTVGARPPQESFQSFQAEYSHYHETARAIHEANMRSSADAVAGRHRGCLENQGVFNTWSTS